LVALDEVHRVKSESFATMTNGGLHHVVLGESREQMCLGFCWFSLINRAVVWVLGPVYLINQVSSLFLSELKELPALFRGSSKNNIS